MCDARPLSVYILPRLVGKPFRRKYFHQMPVGADTYDIEAKRDDLLYRIILLCC